MRNSQTNLKWISPGFHLARNSLIPHIARVNYRLANYKRVHKAIFLRPNPYGPGQGWEKTEESVLKPVWSCGPALPSFLIDLLEKTAEDAKEIAEEEEGQKVDYEAFLSNDK